MLHNKQQTLPFFPLEPARTFLPVILLITDHPPLALRARVLIRRNSISSQSDCPKPPKAEGLISLHQGACVWLGNRTTTPPPLDCSLSGPLRHDLSVLIPVGCVSPGQGSVVRGKGRVGETMSRGASKQAFVAHARAAKHAGLAEENPIVSQHSITRQRKNHSQVCGCGCGCLPWVLFVFLPPLFHSFGLRADEELLSCPGFFLSHAQLWR